ncbi:CopG family transcriptional regulator [Rhizobium deserti]|uniref:CopG family transcriptional regulator n=1 Tax=Rhizobium deserti TaxID=2547961 RepID=A0A4R5UMF6_9HYPH|nr:CopG family transcriptional regulator [Rhizobium deserti]TDK39046.1 CopG family transcriptional regulator [Rhizobium deserti]
MKTISAQEFDERFDRGEDISEYLDWENARSGGEQFGAAELDLPLRLLGTLDREAGKLGVTRQQLVQRWLEERLKERGAAGQDAAQ